MMAPVVIIAGKLSGLPDSRRDSGCHIFNIGIPIGALIAPLLIPVAGAKSMQKRRDATPDHKSAVIMAGTGMRGVQ
jgi:dipeptide/tripeptide permease